MPNGVRYSVLEKDASYGFSGFFRQESTQIHSYSDDIQGELLLFDFSKTVGDTVFYRTDGEYTEVMTVLYDRVQMVFGRPLRQWGFYWTTPPTSAYVLSEVTDSLGLTYVEVEGGNTWHAQGMSIDGVVYGTISEVENEDQQIPVDFELSQNYPNPFNPSTTIRYSIPHSGEASLKIFNLFGEEVATLVSGAKDAGTHTLRWDAAGYPSGVYFYRLRAGGYVETRKLVLLR